jgi:uncharacterized FlaG/YvyC family protein
MTIIYHINFYKRTIKFKDVLKMDEYLKTYHDKLNDSVITMINSETGTEIGKISVPKYLEMESKNSQS